MNSLIFDLMAIVGGALVVAGVYLQYSLPPALMVGGLLLISLALIGAKTNGEMNVPDGE